MDKSLLTKCPHCETLFRIQYEHLSIAGGEVRCGVCYKTFNAQAEGLSFSEGTGSDADTTFGRQPGPADESIAPEIETESERHPADGSKPSLEHIKHLHIATDSPEKRFFPSHRKNKPDRPLLWGTLSLAAICLGLAQWLWFNLDVYAQTAKWRPYYQTFCNKLGCRLPTYQNLELLNTERLSVRSHPQYANALTVDLMVINKAKFAQPLPALTVAFYGINGNTLSQRAFQPWDYLPQDIRDTETLPAGTPMHLSFSIIDPGPEAVNYGLELRTAQP